MEYYLISTTKNSLTSQEAVELWTTLGWGRRGDYDLAKVDKAIDNASFLVSVRNRNKKLIGLARVLSDGVIYTSIADIAVHPDYQNKGVGAKMMEKIRERYGETGIFIETFKENEQFFKKCGYKRRDSMVVLSQRFKSRKY